MTKRDRYLNDTFTPIWRITCHDLNNYCVVQTGKKFMFFRSEDFEEIAYTNYVVKKNHAKLNGKFVVASNYFIHVKNNYLHNTSGPAIFCPGGVNSFKLGEDIEDFLLDGTILTQEEWFVRLKTTKHWPVAVANVLGSRDE